MDTTTSVPLSVGQAAAHANVSTKTVRRWLSSGRLEASRGPDGAWLIDVEALERAVATPGPSTDSPTLANGHGQVTSIVQDLLNRLEAQAERIGHLDAELVSTHLRLADAEQRLYALEAPKPDSAKIASQRASDHVADETMRTPPDGKRPWWRRAWRV